MLSFEFLACCFLYYFIVLFLLRFILRTLPVFVRLPPLIFCSALISFSCSLLIFLAVCVSSQHAPLCLCQFAMLPIVPSFPPFLLCFSRFCYRDYCLCLGFWVLILPLPFWILFACSSWFPYFDPCLPRHPASFWFNEDHWMLPVLLFTAASVPNPVSANEHSGSSNHTPNWIVQTLCRGTHCT